MNLYTLALAAAALAGRLAAAAPDGALDAETYVVTGTRTERRLSDAPVRTELVHKEQIQKSGARTLADALDYSTGVRVENDCNNCNFQQVRLNGMEGPYAAILSDGLPLQSSLARVYGLEQVPASLIERVEIVKGGASALYGPNAVAGVINVIQADPRRTRAEFGHTASSQGGGLNRSSYALLQYASPDGPWGLSLFGQGDALEPVDVNGDGFSEVSRRAFDVFGGRLVLSPWEGGKLSLEAARGYEDRRGGDRLDLPVTQAEIAEAVRAVQRSGSVVLRQDLGASSSLRVHASLSDLERDSYYGAGMDPNAFGDASSRLQDLGFQLDLGSADGRHVFTVGAQKGSEAVRDSTPGYGRLYEALKDGGGIYLQHDWKPLEGLELVYGGRQDYDSLIAKTVFSPRAALKLDPVESLTLRASAASGYRSPLTFDEDSAVSASGGEVILVDNDPDLVEESSHSYSLGAEWRVRPGLSLELGGFANDIRNLFLTEDTDDPATNSVTEYTRRNFGNAAIWGAELNVAWVLGWTQLRLGYAEQRALRDDPDPDFGSREFFRTPQRYGVASVDVDSPWAELFVAARYTGGMKVPHLAGYIAADRLEDSPEFWELDASLSKSVDVSDWLGAGLTLTLGGRNLLDAYQADLDRGGQRDAGYVYGPRYPRGYFASARLDY